MNLNFKYNLLIANYAFFQIFKIDQDVTGPVYVYYELKNFYQNHRRYVASRSSYQLNGEVNY